MMMMTMTIKMIMTIRKNIYWNTLLTSVFTNALSDSSFERFYLKIIPKLAIIGDSGSEKQFRRNG